MNDCNTVTSSVAAEHHHGPSVFIISSASLFGASASSYGLMAIYIGAVLTIGRLVRGALVGLGFRIQLEDMGDRIGFIVQLVEFIYESRMHINMETAKPDLQLEESLYEALINMLRIPEFLMRETGFYKHSFPVEKQHQYPSPVERRRPIANSPPGGGGLPPGSPPGAGDEGSRTPRERESLTPRDQRRARLDLKASENGGGLVQRPRFSSSTSENRGHSRWNTINNLRQSQEMMQRMRSSISPSDLESQPREASIEQTATGADTNPVSLRRSRSDVTDIKEDAFQLDDPREQGARPRLGARILTPSKRGAKITTP